MRKSKKRIATAAKMLDNIDDPLEVTIEMSREELAETLAVDAALARRDHERPTAMPPK